MGERTNAIGEGVAEWDSAATDSALLDVGQVAVLLRCSQRHIYRLSDAGRMPAPVRLGALVRWSRSAVENWIAGGCKSVRQPKAVRR